MFQQLDMVGTQFRRGWVHLIAAAPGGGKSALASFLALSLGVPTLYISPDNDITTFGKGALAFCTKQHVNEAERLLEVDLDQQVEVLDTHTDHMWVSFQPSPTTHSIRQEVDAFATVWGDWPKLIVIDNLMDVDTGGLDGMVGHDAVLEFLKRLGRETSAAILVLAHVTGEYTDGLIPIPRSGVMYKADKRPQFIGTLYQADDNLLGFCIVKNRGGRARADGSLRVMIPWLPEMAFFGTE